MCGKGNTALLVGMKTGATTIKNSMELPQKLKTRTTKESSKPTAGYFSKEKENSEKTHAPLLFIASLFTRATIWKQPKYACRGERIEKMWCVDTMEYYSGMKRKEILPFGTIQTGLESRTLSEISQRKTNAL